MNRLENYSFFILKRDGSKEEYNPEKIRVAIEKAYRAASIKPDKDKISLIVSRVESLLLNKEKEEFKVEEIQDLVEQELMTLNPFIAKRYIIYREYRTVERHKRTKLKQTMDGIVSIEKNDTNRSNANMSGYTPSGQMMTFASEVTKDYAMKYLISNVHAKAHKIGDIHIHDMDYYPTKTTTCVQYDLEDIFERGFRTKNGSVRTPQSIYSYATLATIVFQTNQNEQHGGQAIPAFDFFMAPGVRKTFYKHLEKIILYSSLLLCPENGLSEEILRKIIVGLQPSLSDLDAGVDAVFASLIEICDFLTRDILKNAFQEAYKQTKKDTYQAMEGFIHNLNTMHSRGGNQVVFSSVNYGTDTSVEGRMVVKELLKATVDGLGNGEVPIFPIQIFKVKKGVNYSENDYTQAIGDFEAALKGEKKFETPNFDLLLSACFTSSKALFPNFVFLDTAYNSNDLWKKDDPKRYLYELATMGCRTRVFENLHGLKSSVGRGNLSFTSINLPRIAIQARIDAEESNPAQEKKVIRKEAEKLFLANVRKMSELVADQLYDRYCWQRTALARQYPFMMGNNVWKGGSDLQPDQELGDVINSGTLGIGFIGGHNAMVAIYGEGHARNKEAWQTLYDAILVMNEVAKEYKEKYNLNYSVLATPAEGLSGRFTRLDRERFGVMLGVNDLDYYVNSFHVDVREEVSIMEKIKIEAPFHAITLGGHITYVELDGEAKKNPSVLLKIVKVMYDEGIGYGSVNHPVDTCQSCGYKGVIYGKCPVCKGDDIARLRRITGYLTGTLDSWNSAKQSEERDRVKHS